MKKIYILLLFCASFFSLRAQTYRPLLDSINEWYYVNDHIVFRIGDQQASATCYYPIFVMQGLNDLTDIDTTIGAYTYKRLINGQAGCIEGYLREDTAAQKVYFMDNVFSPEMLLYDFSMQVGDSIAVNFVMTSYYQSGNYVLDSVRTVNTWHGPRRYFYLNCHSCSNNITMVWIEGVGNPEGIIYPYDWNEYGGGTFITCGNFYYAPQIMSCFYHATRVYEDTCMLYLATHSTPCIGFTDSCNYGQICGSVRDLSQAASLDIFPNPSNGKTTLSIDVKQSGEFELLVWDVSRKNLIASHKLGILMPGKKDLEMEFPGLNDGIYFVELRTEEGAVYKKLLIQH